ncbi:MAG: hypothetical protein JO021_23605 [Alphaproteobacteria bacterium]|nr:hypothetical protein [Alphaproteobacteria bacterium]
MRQIERIITGILGAGLPPEPTEPPQALYRDLIAGVDAVPVLQLAIGRAWVLVRTAANAGLAFSPRWPAGVMPALSERLDGLMLRDVARLALRRHDLAAAIGIAAINAHYNRPTLAGAADDGLSDDPSDAPSDAGPTVVIGRFPGLDDKLPGALVIERNPGPRDLPESATERVLPTARRVLITASTLGNHSLPRLLALAPRARVSLIGPGTPLAACLFGHGIAVLAGFVLDRPEAAADAVARGDGAGQLKAFGRRLTLTR